jgi:hypothetical protein
MAYWLRTPGRHTIIDQHAVRTDVNNPSGAGPQTGTELKRLIIVSSLRLAWMVCRLEIDYGSILDRFEKNHREPRDGAQPL